MTDFTLPAATRLRQSLVASDLQADIERAEIIFEQVEPSVEPPYNTRALTELRLDGQFMNQLAVYYNRLPLSGIATTLYIDNPAAVTTHDILPTILSVYGVNLEPSDIVLETLTTPIHILKAADASIGWIGQVNVELGDVGPIPFTLYRTQNERLIMVNGLYLRKT